MIDMIWVERDLCCRDGVPIVAQAPCPRVLLVLDLNLSRRGLHRPLPGLPATSALLLVSRNLSYWMIEIAGPRRELSPRRSAAHGWRCCW